MARKNATRWTRDEEGPILQVEVEGDSPDRANGVGSGAVQRARDAFVAGLSPEQETSPGQEGGGFGGPEYDVASMPVVEGYDDDPGEEYDADAHALEVARERWREVQSAQGNQAADAGWDEPYEEPDPKQSEAEYEAWWQAPEGQGVTDRHGLTEEQVQTFGMELEKQNIDPTSVQPTFLQNRFGLTREQAVALTQQLVDTFGVEDNIERYSSWSGR